MPYQFNPITGQLDLVSASAVLDGEVETWAGLPQTVGDPPVGSTYFVKASTGVWLVNRRQAGIWLRTADTGVRADDWTYGGDYPVTSVNGQTGAVVLDATHVGALQSALSFEEYIFDGFTETLPARRNTYWNVTFIVSGQTRTLNFPNNGAQVGDRLRVSLTVPANTILNVVRSGLGANVTIATVGAGTRFIYSAQVTQISGGTAIWESSGEMSAAIGASPATSSSTGTVGQFSFSDNFMYVCIADNTWRRVPIAAF